MKKQAALILCLTPLLITTILTNVNAQTETYWQKVYEGANPNENRGIQQTRDGGYIIACSAMVNGFDSSNFYLLKIDASGNLTWKKTFGGTQYAVATAVQQTSDGGYIVTGGISPYAAGGWHVYLLKTDSSGNQMWNSTYGGTKEDFGSSVQQTRDGGYIIAGDTSSFGAGGYDVCLVKTDSSGKLIWQETYGGPEEDDGLSVQQTRDGGYIISGGSTSFGSGSFDVYLVKTDPSGKQLWQGTYGAGVGESVQQTTDDGYIIGGSTGAFGAGGTDFYLVKTDSSGKQMWNSTYGGALDEGGFSVQQTTDGGYILGGETRSFGAGDLDVYLVKTDSLGRLMWQRTFGGSGLDTCTVVRQTSDGGYIVAGGTVLYKVYAYDVYVIKTDSLGNSPPTPLATPNLISPVQYGKVTEHLVNLSWTNSSGAGYYTIDVSGPTRLSVNTTKTEVAGTLSDGNYTWRVSAYNNVNYSNWTSAWSFTVDTRPTGDLWVGVKDPNGNNVSGANVTSFLQPSGEHALGKVTGVDGVASFTAILTGNYTVQASKSGYLSASRSAYVVSGGSKNITITLQAQSTGTQVIPGYTNEAVITGFMLAVLLIVYNFKRKASIAYS
jgi:hypothetical protein